MVGGSGFGYLDHDRRSLPSNSRRLFLDDLRLNLVRDERLVGLEVVEVEDAVQVIDLVAPGPGPAAPRPLMRKTLEWRSRPLAFTHMARVTRPW